MARKKQRATRTTVRDVSVPRDESPHKIRPIDLRTISPMTKTQDVFFREYRKHNRAFLLHGLAGTGKSFIALYNAFRDIFDDASPFKKILIIRSAVASRDIGHLPGDEKEKTDIFAQPYKDICADLFPRFGPKAFLKLKEQGLIDFMVTSYVRGLTFEDTIVIVDECQSMTFHELDTIMTRLGNQTKIMFCGDYRQNDLITKKYDVSGLREFMNILRRMPDFTSLEFTCDDICRSDIVKSYIIEKTEYQATHPH
jgi:phosphate starvation-inducible protein PhoH